MTLIAAHAFWGDSMTTNMLANVGTPATQGYVENIYNGGVGGENSSEILARWQADSTRRNWNQVIWAGQNWTTAVQLKADIASIVAALNHSRYLIVSVINDGTTATDQGPSGARYLEKVAANADLAALYGDRFFDLRAALVAYGVGIADAQSVNYDAPPSTYQPTDIHFNADGYNDAGSRIRTKLSDLGWLSDGTARQQIGMAGGR